MIFCLLLSVFFKIHSLEWICSCGATCIASSLKRVSNLILCGSPFCKSCTGEFQVAYSTGLTRWANKSFDPVDLLVTQIWDSSPLISRAKISLWETVLDSSFGNVKLISYLLVGKFEIAKCVNLGAFKLCKSLMFWALEELVIDRGIIRKILVFFTVNVEYCEQIVG